MRSRTAHRLLSLPIALMAIVLVPTTAGAAEPTLYELPDATHALTLAPAADGTLWFEPFHGEEWAGPDGESVGRIAVDGTVGEVPVPGFLDRPVAGRGGDVWLAGIGAKAGSEKALNVGRLLPSGEITAKRSVISRSEGIGTIAVGPGEVWVSQFRRGKRDWVDRVPNGGGRVRRAFVVGPDCRVNAMTVAANGTLWFAEACQQMLHGEYRPGHSNIGHVASGTVTRRRVPNLGTPESLALGPHGTVWFGVTHFLSYSWDVGRLAHGKSYAEYRVPHGSLDSIAVATDGRLWFRSSFGGGVHRALDWIDTRGRIGEPICADPACELEPVGLTAGPDGSLWYGLTVPHSIGGGGLTQQLEGIAIGNEAGFVAHLVP